MSSVSDLKVENLKVSPNPFSSFTSVEIPKDFQKGSVSVKNAFGEILQNIPFEESQYYTIDGSLFPSGIYFIEILSEDKRRMIAKIVKK